MRRCRNFVRIRDVMMASLRISAFHLIALGFALVYIGVAAGFIREDRKPSLGGFISLQGMGSFLVVLPVALPVESWYRKLNFRSNVEMGWAVVACATLVYGVVFCLIAGAVAIWRWFHAGG